MELTGQQRGVLEQLASAAREETLGSFGTLGVVAGGVLVARAGLFTRGELPSDFPAQEDSLVAVYIPLMGSVGGCGMLLATESEVQHLTGSLLGPAGGRSVDLDRRAESALTESVSILANGSFNVVNRFLGLITTPGPPRILRTTRKEFAALVAKGLWPHEEAVMMITLRLEIAGRPAGTLVCAVAVHSEEHLRRLLSLLAGDSAGGEPGTDPGASEDSEQMFVEAVRRPAHDLDRRSTPGGDVARGEQRSRESMRILVVDDSSYFRTRVARLLAGQGFSDIVEAADGRSAAQLYAERRPDVVLLDIVMAGESGQSTLREIRRLDPSACVIIVSAVGQEEMMQECLAQGAAGFLAKPVSAERLAAEMRRVVLH